MKEHGKWRFSGRQTSDIRAEFYPEGSKEPTQRITLPWEAYQYFVKGVLAEGHEVDDSNVRSVFYDPGYG